MGVKKFTDLVKMLERDIRELSLAVLEDAEHNLLSDEPEALVRREIGLMKERERRRIKSLNHDDFSKVF